MDDDRALRRRPRAAWPIHVCQLGAEPSANSSATTTAEERLAMMWPLACAAWSLAGWKDEPLPRSQWPVRVTTLADQ